MRWTRRVTESVFWLERNVMSIAKQLGAANSEQQSVSCLFIYQYTARCACVCACVGGCVCQFDCVLPASCQFHCQDIEARKLVYRKSGFGQGAIAVAGERQAEVRWVTVGCGVVWRTKGAETSVCRQYQKIVCGRRCLDLPLPEQN